MNWIDGQIQHFVSRPGFWPASMQMAAWLLFFILARRSIGLIGLAAFPGVFLHELAHFVAGLLLRARPLKMDIFPRRSETGWVMGSVSFARLGFLNSGPIAFAPLVLLPCALWMFSCAMSQWASNSYYGAAVLCFLTATTARASAPSMTDCRLGVLSILGYAGIIAAGLWIHKTLF